MDKIFADPRRWLFFLTIILLLIVAFGIRIYLGSTDPDELIKRLLEGFICSVLVTIMVAWVIHLGTLDRQRARESLEIIAAGDIKGRFQSAHNQATYWYFKGGLGRYFTAKTLPGVLSNGRNGYALRAFIVDPFNSTLCEFVAHHRGMRASDVRTEALVTVIEFVRQVHTSITSVDTAICGLIDDFTPLRTDMTDEGVIITHDEKTAPAIYHKADSPFYKGIKQELTTAPNSYKKFDVCKIAKILNMPAPASGGALTREYADSVVKTIVSELQAGAPCSEAELKHLVTVATTRKSPY